jgi:hypothetical protein
MKNPCRLAALLLILPFLGLAAFPRAGRAAEDATDAIEKELLSVLREMDALSSELARIEEIVAVPKATSLRLEIRRAGDLPAPASSKMYLSGKVEAERDWSREEKERFLSGAGPVVLDVPALPGAYEGVLLLSHPSWKTSPAFTFRPTVKAGGTYLLRVTLSLPPGSKEPVLVPTPEK